MRKAVFITATDTGAGKTWVTQQLLKLLLASREDAQALKPIASGIQSSGLNEDVEALLLEQPEKDAKAINYQTFQHPVAPALAAKLEQKTLDAASLLAWLNQQRHQHEITLIEGVGGLMVPLVADAPQQIWLVSDWLQAMPDVDVLLVVPLRLGCMNHTLLNCKLLAAMNRAPKWIVLNDIEHHGTGVETMATLKPCLAAIFDVLPQIICLDQPQDLSAICEELRRY